MPAYQSLLQHFATLSHLQHLQAITSWDEAVMMPRGGGEARTKALATLSTILHDQISNRNIGELIAEAKQETLESDWQRANLQLMEKHYLHANYLPRDLVAALTTARLRCEQAWRQLREKNDWQSFRPLLQTVVDLVKESANIRAKALSLSAYDVLIDEFSPGMTQQQINPIFDTLKATLPPLIERIMQRQQSINTTHLIGPFSIEQQKQLGLELMRSIGFDFEHGRLDISHHPFCGGVAEDVRITTRYNTEEFISSAMGTCHETGHACYEQGLPREWIEQPVGMAQGIAMHESQSLLIEMQACRSQAFMQFIAPLLSKHFGKQAGFTPDNLFHVYTTVKPGLIRVDADEVTYPLHVILRYELEQALIAGELTVDELPIAWNDKMQQYFGLSTLANDKDGVMQDVHWPSAAFGYFPSYTLGSLIAAQLFHTAQQQHPEIQQQLRQGDFTSLMCWLRQHIHSKGSLLSTTELLAQATGQALNPQYFLKHVQRRYLNESTSD